MLSKQFIFELFFLFLLSGSQAQTEIKGYVLALPGKNPIAFANIGILNASVGTISDQDGSFSLSIASQYFRDSIIFSALGYEPLKIPIRKLIDNRQMTVYLRETAYRLSEVVVMAERGTTKSMSIGNQHFDGSSLYGDTINAGSSMALLIKSINRRGKKNIDFPAYLKEAEVLILNNTFPDFKIRVRVYDVDTIKGKLLPGRDLLEASVVEQSNIKDGWLSFDLSEYRLLVEKDFFIVFEWILEKKDRAALYKQYESFKKENPDKVALNYSWVDGKKVTFDNYQGNFYFGTSFGISVSAPILKDNICYYRLNSFGQWYPSPSVLTARVRLSKWLEGAHPDELDATMEDSLESNKLLSYYQVNQVETISPQRDLTEEQLPDPLFSTRKFEPLDIYVSRNENRFSFYAFNRGYFPYQLKLNFSNILNLHPLITEKEYVVYPGRKQLLILDVVDRDVQNYHYDLEISEDIGDPELIAQDSFVYLTPVKKILLNGDQTTGNKHSNRFYGNFQDSIFAMRRGIITAIPGKLDDLDRIGGQNSLEILHGDGSVAVYTGIDSASITFEPGASVFSGDFLGQIDKEGFVDVQVFKIEAREKLVLMPVRFYLGYGRIGNATESIPGLLDYPEEILYRELSDRERRKKVH